MCRLTSCKVNTFISNTTELPQSTKTPQQVLKCQRKKSLGISKKPVVILVFFNNSERFLHTLFQQKTDNSRCETVSLLKQSNKKLSNIFFGLFLVLNFYLSKGLITCFLIHSLFSFFCYSSIPISTNTGLETFKVSSNKVGKLSNTQEVNYII